MRFLGSLALPLVSAYVIADQHQLPIVESGDAFGVGIHLTTSYAIAAIRHENGKLEDLVRVQANAEYIDAMSRLSDVARRRKCDMPAESLLCETESLIRRMNKASGKPASPDVGALASLLRDVKDAVEEKLQRPVRNVFPVFPVLAALEDRDIQDALDYAHLTWLPTEDLPHWETNAAYVGSGHGLCSSSYNLEQCRQEESAMELEHVLFLNFDNSSFTATFHPMHSAYWQNPNAYVLDTELGWYVRSEVTSMHANGRRYNLPIDDVTRANFWTEVQDVIVSVVEPINRIPKKIILLGDHADDAEFRDAIKAALWETFEFDAAQLLEPNVGVNATTLAARGAAKWAFRLEHSLNQETEPVSDLMEL